MKRIYSAMIETTMNKGEYQMAEINECEYGEEWDGNVLGFIENLDCYNNMDCTIEGENALGNIHQNFGKFDPIPGSIRVVMVNGEPTTIYWANEEEDDDSDIEEIFSSESFGAGPVPENWEDICGYLNEKAARAKKKTPEDELGDMLDEIWESYWEGDYPDAPEAIVKDEITNKYTITFYAGTGKHFSGSVNYLIVDHDSNVTIYAECPVPDECSDDYGYITMKNAIIKAFEKAGGNPKQLSFWYDGQEQYLAPDAAADCEVYVDIDLYEE